MNLLNKIVLQLISVISKIWAVTSMRLISANICARQRKSGDKLGWDGGISLGPWDVPLWKGGPKFGHFLNNSEAVIDVVEAGVFWHSQNEDLLIEWPNFLNFPQNLSSEIARRLLIVQERGYLASPTEGRFESEKLQTICAHTGANSEMANFKNSRVTGHSRL